MVPTNCDVFHQVETVHRVAKESCLGLHPQAILFMLLNVPAGDLDLLSNFSNIILIHILESSLAAHQPQNMSLFLKFIVGSLEIDLSVLKLIYSAVHVT